MECAPPVMQTKWLLLLAQMASLAAGVGAAAAQPASVFFSQRFLCWLTKNRIFVNLVVD